MKCSVMASLAVFTAVVLTIAAATTPTAADRGQIATGQAVLTSMHGDVQVRHGARGYAPATLNAVLRPGDAVKTGAGSRAELSVAGGGFVRMNEGSQVLITALEAGGTSSFQALAGGLWVTLERALGGSSKFEVRMPSAVASVKGTVFRVEVDADGNSTTWVYEGAVDIEADDERFEVTPDRQCRVHRGLPGIVDRFNLRGDDEAAWVMYNRHRDIVRHLGDPTISVSLREHGMPEPGGVTASDVISGQLTLHGLESTAGVGADAARFDLREDGSIDWLRAPDTDYCVIGDVTLEQMTRIDGRWTARIAGGIHLVRGSEAEALTSISMRVSGAGGSTELATAAALEQLGNRVGAGLAPRVIREMMQERPGTVRVDISGGTREQVGQLRRAIAQNRGALRTVPLVLSGNRISLAVATELSPEEIARILRAEGDGWIEQLAAGDHVIYVRLPGDPEDRSPIIREEMGAAGDAVRGTGGVQTRSQERRPGAEPRMRRPMHR